MISRDINNIVEKSNVGETSSFRINGSAKAFQILSSGIYSEKILALVREYGSNSKDAHAEAGNTNPFEVHLPNTLEPWFSIKDFGKGLSHEDIAHLYTTYFESTKSNSNDSIGMFGIGGKSAYSYTDNFSVSSRFNGTIRCYTMYINETGCPAVSLMSENPTDELNGLEVSIAVKSNDFSEFAAKASMVFRRFDIVPIITGNKSCNIKQINYSLRGLNWGLCRYDENNRESCRAVAVMGCVGYTVDSLSNDNSIPQNLRQILSLPIDMFFDIGDLDVAASRETLSLDKLTKERIIERLQKIQNEVIEVAQKKVTEAPTLWDARLAVYELAVYERANKTFSQFTISNVVFTWNGQTVTHGVVKLSENGEKSVRYFYRMGRKNCCYDVSELVPNVRIVFVSNDLERGTYTRVRKYLNDNYGSEVVLLDSNKEKIIAKLGIDPTTVILASSLPKNITLRGSISDKGKAKILEYNEYNYLAAREWNVTNANPEDGGIYIPIFAYKHIGGERSSKYIAGLVKKLTDFGINFDEPIYGIKDHYVHKAQKLGEWVSLQDYVMKTISDIVQTEEFQKKQSDYEDFLSASENIQAIKVLKKLPNIICDKIIKLKESWELASIEVDRNIQEKILLAERLGVTVKTNTSRTFDLANQCKALFLEYPLLKYFSDSEAVETKEVEDYIAMVKLMKATK